jgi:hypothetical protein
MPYTIKKVNNGFKVCKKYDLNKCFSNKPLTKKVAKKQLKAIGMHGKGINKNFENQLNNIGLDSKDYLYYARFLAKNRGYEPNLIEFSDKKNKKLMYNNEIHFGAVNYNDKIIYSFLELNDKIPKGTTKIKVDNYRKRAEEIKNKSNKYSPSNLSYYILW